MEETWRYGVPSDTPYTIHRGMDGKPDGWYVASSAGNAVCHVHQIAGEPSARLIAAAPDLLAALEVCESAMLAQDSDTSDADRFYRYTLIARDVRAAIRKATGE